jgi:hypothetical protein
MTRINGSTTQAIRPPKPDTTVNAALEKKATAFITANAGDAWGKKFPAIDSGNLGVSAFVPTPAQAKALLATAKEMAPGAKDIVNAKLDPAKQQLVVVLTSDDEPAIHLCLQDKTTGAMKHLGNVSAIDLPSKEGDWSKPLTTLAKGAQWLKLGEGSAEPNWWK